MPEYEDEINTRMAAATRHKVTGSSICFGTDSPTMPTTRHSRVTAEEVESATHSIEIPTADAIRMKNGSSSICFGTDSPAPTTRCSRTASEVLAAPPVASPHTLRERQFGGHREEMRWDLHGGATPLQNRHAPLTANPEMPIASYEQNRTHNQSSQISFEGDDGLRSQSAGLIDQHYPRVHSRVTGTTREETSKFAERLAMPSPHTAKQRVMGSTITAGADENTDGFHTARGGVQRTLVESSVVFGDSVSCSPMQTTQSRGKQYGASVSSSTEDSRQALVSSAAANKRRFESTSLSLW
jgi:hypothetical protein